MALCCYAPRGANPVELPETVNIVDGKMMPRCLHEFPTGRFGWKYEGETVGGKRHGQGKMRWDATAGLCNSLANVTSYDGQWENDLAHGEGTFTHPNGCTYTGQWQYGKAHGAGNYTRPGDEGDPPELTFTGSWLEDQQDGPGLEIWNDPIDGESSYEGQYQGGRKHGYGKFTSASGDTYEGRFENNNMHGRGVYLWKDGRSYEGDWADNMLDGFGRFDWGDGNWYEGEYVANVRCGTGTHHYADGREYSGEWKDGRQQGKGAYKSFLDEVRTGQWTDSRHAVWTDGGEENNAPLQNFGTNEVKF